jgi:hypothetical protein
MKVIAIIALTLIFSFNPAGKKGMDSMNGAYKMLYQSWSSGTADSTYWNIKQLKIYTGDFMMYANVNPADSVSGFGIATYTVKDNILVENVLYNASDTSFNDTQASFTLLIEKTKKGFKQVIPEMDNGDQKTKLTEEYESVGKQVKTPLDGSWKEIRSYTMKGNEMTENKVTQYKTYYAGHFMFGHTYQDDKNKTHTGIGFGSFSMKGNKVKENIEASTYYQIRGKTVELEIEMTGKDQYKQTITNVNGEKSVELYERMKP